MYLFSTCPSSSHLLHYASSQLHVPFFKTNKLKSLNLISASHVHMGMGSFTEAWTTYQEPHSWKELTLSSISHQLSRTQLRVGPMILSSLHAEMLTGLVLCMQLWLLWIHECKALPCLEDVLPCSSPTAGFYDCLLSFEDVPWALWGEVLYRVPFKALFSTIAFSLYTDQLQVSAVA